MNKWILYEALKDKIEAMNLPPEEYGKKIREMAKELKI